MRRPGQTLLINGIGGQLGLNAARVAPGMGATRILGPGRNAALLDRVRSPAPGRIDVLALPYARAREAAPGQADPLVAWARSATDGHGVDGMIDCLPPGAPASAMLRALLCVRRGGHAVNVGAVMETLPLNPFWLMTNRIGPAGSVWFATGEGEDLAATASTRSGRQGTSSDFPMTDHNHLLSYVPAKLRRGPSNYDGYPSHERS